MTSSRLLLYLLMICCALRYRCLVSRLCAGWAVVRSAHLSWRQWGGSVGGNHQGKNQFCSQCFIFSVEDKVFIPSWSFPSCPSRSVQVLGTPTREQIREMNPNYTEFKFPQIKAHPWTKVSQQVQERFFLFLKFSVLPCCETMFVKTTHPSTPITSSI